MTVATTELLGIDPDAKEVYMFLTMHNLQDLALYINIICTVTSCVNRCPFVTVTYKCMYFKTDPLLRTFGTSNYSHKNIQCTRL